MIFQVYFTEKAKLQLKKLPKEVQKRMISVLKRIVIKPHRYVRKVRSTDFFRVRIGEYRAIIDIDNKKFTILVIFIGNKKNIYKEINKPK